MMKPTVPKVLVLISFLCASYFMYGQSKLMRDTIISRSEKEKPYKILTNGRQITLKLREDLKTVLVWAASGHRVVEQKNINNETFTFTVPAREKIFFILMETTDGNRYTEKIGVQ